ncbi:MULTISPECIES: hypothetical protein [Massilia]|uniref:Uncharacterized protein n=1 Tax=Massilia mucilaginosa TaxID=2609282 RepID=A0ABX0NWL1_9BURK|nr:MULTISPECIES: hypothetical protein [Massilia]NHZ91153.1 hypothetical protein [Massilia mucilaginosa]NHZ94516.1 hypothetical protein [Massilia sp. CCM 8734]
MSHDNNPITRALRRLETRFDDSDLRMRDFLAAEAAGEKPDPDSFLRMLEQRSVTRRAMESQAKLHEKPLKTVLSEAK